MVTKCIPSSVSFGQNTVPRPFCCSPSCGEAALYKALCDKYIPELKLGDAPMRTDAWATSRPASSEPEPDSPEEEPEPKAPSASAAATPALVSVKQEVPEAEAEAEGSAAAAVKQELPPKKRRKHRHAAAGAGEEAGGLQAVKAEDAPAAATAAAPAQDQLRGTKQSAQDAGRKAKHAEASQAPPAAAGAAGEPEGGTEGPGEAAPPRRKKRRRTAAGVPEARLGLTNKHTLRSAVCANHTCYRTTLCVRGAQAASKHFLSSTHTDIQTCSCI